MDNKNFSRHGYGVVELRIISWLYMTTPRCFEPTIEIVSDRFGNAAFNQETYDLNYN